MRKVLSRCKHILIALLLPLLWSCGEQQSTARTDSAVQHLPADEVHNMIEKNPGITVIDVRTAEEFSGELGHIPGSQLKPLPEIESWASQMDSLKDEEIILVCRSGNRSGHAARYLEERGFKHLVNVKGGMREWNKMGYEIEK